MLPLSQVSEAKFYPVFRFQFFSWSVDGPLISTLLELGTSQEALGMLDHKGHFQGLFSLTLERIMGHLTEETILSVIPELQRCRFRTYELYVKSRLPRWH